MKFLPDLSKFILFLFIQLVLENIVQILCGDIAIRVSFSIIFILNLILFFFFNRAWLFYLFQFIIVIAYPLIIIPHNYDFNIFSFYLCSYYFLINPFQFSNYLIYFGLSAVVVCLIIFAQFTLIKSVTRRKSFLLIFLCLILVAKTVFHSQTFFVDSKKVIITFINQNKASDLIIDYKQLVKAETTITNYKCIPCGNISPSIKYLHNNTDKRSLLLIVESWGELFNNENQQKCIDFLRERFMGKQNLNEKYNITFGHTCSNGNSSAAEGRELLNMNDEESFKAFMYKGISPAFNLTDYKNQNNYHTISGSSSSKKYGTNWGRAEGLRIKLGFKSRFYYEELIQKYESNNENTYKAVYDESMIDSLINESKIFEKVFAYGFTINTHSVFKLNMDKIDKTSYANVKSRLLSCFENKTNAFDQFFRISEIIDHTFQQLDINNGLFDKVLIIGDHASHDLNIRSIYNKKYVPYILIERKI